MIAILTERNTVRVTFDGHLKNIGALVTVRYSNSTHQWTASSQLTYRDKVLNVSATLSGIDKNGDMKILQHSKKEKNSGYIHPDLHVECMLQPVAGRVDLNDVPALKQRGVQTSIENFFAPFIFSLGAVDNSSIVH